MSEVIQVPLTQGKVALIDQVDSGILQFKWYAVLGETGIWHAFRAKWNNGERGTVPMHRQILGLEDCAYPLVDHGDRDGLNNRRYNLRVATQSQNQMNSKHRGNATGFRGVTFHSDSRKKCWQARIVLDPGRGYRSLGYFETPTEAAIARDMAAIEHYGVFATLNFPELLNHEQQRAC